MGIGDKRICVDPDPQPAARGAAGDMPNKNPAVSDLSAGHFESDSDGT